MLSSADCTGASLGY